MIKYLQLHVVHILIPELQVYNVHVVPLKIKTILSKGMKRMVVFISREMLLKDSVVTVKRLLRRPDLAFKGKAVSKVFN